MSENRYVVLLTDKLFGTSVADYENAYTLAELLDKEVPDLRERIFRVIEKKAIDLGYGNKQLEEAQADSIIALLKGEGK